MCGSYLEVLERAPGLRGLDIGLKLNESDVATSWDQTYLLEAWEPVGEGDTYVSFPNIQSYIVPIDLRSLIDTATLLLQCHVALQGGSTGISIQIPDDDTIANGPITYSSVTTLIDLGTQLGHLLLEEHGEHHLVGLLREVGEEQDLVGELLPSRLSTGH